MLICYDRNNSGTGFFCIVFNEFNEETGDFGMDFPNFPLKYCEQSSVNQKMTKISGFSLWNKFSKNLFFLKNFTTSRRSRVFWGEKSPKKAPIGFFLGDTN